MQKRSARTGLLRKGGDEPMNKRVRVLQIAFVGSLVVGFLLAAGGLGGWRTSALQQTPEPTALHTPTPQPGFVMVPDQGLPGQEIEVEGFGWSKNSRVEMTWAGTTLPTDPKNLFTDQDGHFLGTFAVPAGALQGTHIVRVTIAGTWAEEPFYVVPPTPTSPPPPTTPPRSEGGRRALRATSV